MRTGANINSAYGALLRRPGLHAIGVARQTATPSLASAPTNAETVPWAARGVAATRAPSSMRAKTPL